MDTAVRKPRIVAFEVTRRCKMNCIHCRASANADFADDLETIQCKKIIKSIADYNKCVLIFTGGEPFERNDIFELIDYANSCGLAISLATCGYNFDKEKAERLKKAGVLTLSFSLDSDDAKEHDNFRQTAGAFEKTLKAIDIAKTAGLKFQINTTVTKLNADKLPAIAKLSESLGAYCFNPFMLVPAGRGKELADIALSSKEYEKVLRTVADLKNTSEIEVRFTCAPRFAVVYSLAVAGTATHLAPAARGGVKVGGCLAASDFAFISHAGDVQTCGFLKISAGNILQTGDFASIWEKSDFLNSIRQKKFSGKCGSCNFVNICGGCRARAFAHSGDYLASDPLCDCLAPPLQWRGYRAANVNERSSSVSTLIAAHIEGNKIAEAADVINALPGVSHNYLRKHYYNLWFTLKSSNVEEIIKDLSKRFETDFYSFPSTVRYKLDLSAIKKHNPPDNFNALFCCRIDSVIARSPDESGRRSNLRHSDVFQAAAKYLCNLPQVSHCYQRKTFENWPYNLYAMIHETSSEQIEKIVAQFVSEFKIEQFQLLPTIRSLKN